MTKLLLGIVAVCAVGTALALDKNVWTGNGGDIRWANMDGWTCG